MDQRWSLPCQPLLLPTALMKNFLCLYSPSFILSVFDEFMKSLIYWIALAQE